MITDEQLQQQAEIENDNRWLGTFAELPQIGDVYEFECSFDEYDDKDYSETITTKVRLIVVDVTAEHVMYKMPGVSVNKIFPMTLEVWKENTDERCKVTE